MPASKKTRSSVSSASSRPPPPTLPPFDNDEEEEEVDAAAAAAAGGNDDDDEDEEETTKQQQPARKKSKKVKESIIDHTYRDYSQVEAPEDEEDIKSDRKGRADFSRTFQSFPAKLHAILSNPNYQHIIRWMPHGRCWSIVDKYLLTTVLLPRYFAHGKFESFNRSVNGWGFKRLLRDGPDKRAYYHECFLRGRPELTKLMTRLCNPGKRLPDKNGEPDFYEISRKYPLPELPSVCTNPGEQSDLDALHPMRSPSGAGAASSAHPHSVQRMLFASPPTGANINRNSQGTAAQLPPMYLPAGPMGMEHPAFHQQSPFGFYAPSQFMMAPPQSMPGGPPGYYVVYQPPPMFMQAPPGAAGGGAAQLSYGAASSVGGQHPDMAALLAATAMTSAAGMGRDTMKPALAVQAEETTGETSGEARVKTEIDGDAKPIAMNGVGNGEGKGKGAKGGVTNSIAEV